MHAKGWFRDRMGCQGGKGRLASTGGMLTLFMSILG